MFFNSFKTVRFSFLPKYATPFLFFATSTKRICPPIYLTPFQAFAFTDLKIVSLAASLYLTRLAMPAKTRVYPNVACIYFQHIHCLVSLIAKFSTLNIDG
jgi:hypothetical protein